MADYQVSWETKDAPQRKSRKLATEEEARGFIKGLKVCGLYVRVSLWRVAEDGKRARVQIGHATSGVQNGSSPPEHGSADEAPYA